MVIAYILVFLVGCSSSQQPGISDSNPEGIISNGTKVDELDLSGLSFNEGQNKLIDWAKDKLEETRLLVYNNTEVPVSLRELGLELNITKTWESIRNRPGYSVPSVLQIDVAKPSQTLQTKLSGLVSAPQDASYKIENDKVIIKPAIPGRVLATDSLLKGLEGLSFAKIPPKIALAVKEVPAKVTTEALKTQAFDAVIAEFSTKFSTDDTNRVINLSAAAKALDKKEIRPDEVFSFNDTIGPRTEQTGYKEAKIIIDNEYVLGTGGGVCQVSSTLYNAILLANLPIVQRSPHAVIVGYVPLGQDATVNYPTIDLKFKNNTSGLIYIRTEVTPKTLTIKLWGKKNTNIVRIVNEVEKEMDFQTERRFDQNLPAGKIVQEQAGSKGYIVKTWRVVQDAQGKVVEQFLSRDIYAATHRILKFGPG